jgi:hypothetical protein
MFKSPRHRPGWISIIDPRESQPFKEVGGDQLPVDLIWVFFDESLYRSFFNAQPAESQLPRVKQSLDGIFAHLQDSAGPPEGIRAADAARFLSGSSILSGLSFSALHRFQNSLWRASQNGNHCIVPNDLDLSSLAELLD